MKDYKDENDWMAAFRKGSKRAFELIFRQYYSSLCYFAYKYLGDHAQAEDIVEDVFEKLWVGKRTQESLIHLRYYLYLATKRSCIDYLRTSVNEKKSHMAFVLENGSEEPEYIHNIIRAEVLREIHQAIKDLPSQCSKVMMMSYIQGVKNLDIAEALGISIQTVKNQKTIGVSLLKKQLSADLFLLFLLFFFKK